MRLALRAGRTKWGNRLMAIYDIPYADWESRWKPTKGTWTIFAGKYVKVSCPECGAFGSLDHTVADDGTLSPSLVCPDECGFHVFARLVDYQQHASKTEGGGNA